MSPFARFRLLALVLLLLACGVSVASAVYPDPNIDDVVLNELLFDPHDINPSVGQDCDGDGTPGEDGGGGGAHDEFVELYNTGTTAVDLGGYCLADEEVMVGGTVSTGTHRWAIPAGETIAPDGYWHVCGGDDDRGFGFSVPDANGDQISQFNNSDGDWVSLYRPTIEGNCGSAVADVIFSIDYPVNNEPGESYQRCPDGSGALDYYEESGYFYYPTPGSSNCAGTVPVTLASFAASRVGGEIHFSWSTVTETGNLGFNLYVEQGGQRVKINDQLILSHAMSTLEPQTYSFTAGDLAGTTFYIEDVDMFARGTLNGPFTLGEAYGSAAQVEAIDWTAVRAEQARTMTRQETAEATPQRQAAGEDAAPGPLTVRLSENGLYRMSYADLIAVDPAWEGAPTADIALLNRGAAVPIYVGSDDDKVNAGDTIEFYGEALDTLYTKENVYTLTLDAAQARRVAVDERAPRGRPAGHYVEIHTTDKNRAYATSAPIADPWYELYVVAQGSPVARTFPLEVDAHAAQAGGALLRLEVWGANDDPLPNDHHFRVAVNDVALGEAWFDGITGYTFEAPIPAGVLHDGENTLRVTVPGDSGAAVEYLVIDRYTVAYPRHFVAREDSLFFAASAPAFVVRGFSGPEIVAYRLTQRGVTRLDGLTTAADGANGYTATLPGARRGAAYAVATVDSLKRPTITRARPTADITSGRADYLMISHPSFSDGLQELVAFHESQGLTVKVVDVRDVYAQFSDGIVAPEAIKAYLAYGAQQMGVRYVLLVGGDTYDYHDYLGRGSISFVPTLYGATGPYVGHAPLDAKYADVDDDNVPDLRLGRLPVRTRAELANAIDKTLRYATAAYGGTAVFAADAHDGSQSYTADSDSFIAQLPPGWQIERVYLDEMPVAAAHDLLMARMNEGVALVNFTGHSGTTHWTWQGLLTAAHVKALSNAEKPMVVAQYGCWNTYHVQPGYSTMAHNFVLGENQGAAAVMGAATLTDAGAERLLGELINAHLGQPGVTLGAAMQMAKAELEAARPGLVDVQLGWTLLGDPALSLARPSSAGADAER